MVLQSSARLILLAFTLLSSRAVSSKQEMTQGKLVTGMDKEHNTLRPQAGVTAASHDRQEKVDVWLQGSKVAVKVDKARREPGERDAIFRDPRASMGKCAVIADQAANAAPAHSSAVMSLFQSWNATSAGPHPLVYSPGEVRKQLAAMADASKHHSSPLHVAAMNYDSYWEVMWVGLNIKKTESLAPEALSICWCNDGAWLNMGCASYKITSIMHEGKSLCMDQCHMSQVIQDNLKQHRTPEYTVQLKILPNAPFRVKTLAANQDTDMTDGVLKVSMEFTSGDLGLMVPGMIGMSSKTVPLGVYRGNEKIGCIKQIANSNDKVEIRQNIREYKPKFREVTLMRGPDNQYKHSYALTDPEPHWEDSQMCLVKEMESILRGGDAEIELCQAYPAN